MPKLNYFSGPSLYYNRHYEVKLQQDIVTTHDDQIFNFLAPDQQRAFISSSKELAKPLDYSQYNDLLLLEIQMTRDQTSYDRQDYTLL